MYDKASFLSYSGYKYVVIGKAVWENDPVALSIAPNPRHFSLEGTEYTIISLEPLSIPELLSYMEAQNGQYEFEWNIGNGKASFLVHEQILALLNTLPNNEE